MSAQPEPMSESPDEIWRRIEAEALAQVRAELAQIERTPLEFGQFIAWAICRFGRTDDLSFVHRVGHPVGERPFTSCGERIPEPIRWLPLSPRLAETIARCRHCEAEYARFLKSPKGEQAHAA